MPGSKYRDADKPFYLLSVPLGALAFLSAVLFNYSCNQGHRIEDRTGDGIQDSVVIHPILNELYEGYRLQDGRIAYKTRQILSTRDPSQPSAPKNPDSPRP